MLCHYLRHIDLLAVYEQLPNYEFGLVGQALANIPPQLSDTISAYLRDLADIATMDSYGHIDWRHMDPIEIAAAVGDLIEIELERIEGATGTPALLADTELKAGESLGSFLCFVAEAQLATELDHIAATCLVVYQYDGLCFLHSCGNIADVLAVFESIAETRESLIHALGQEAKRCWRSHEARKLAAQRHASTNEQKSVLLAEWDTSGSEYESRADFARIVSQREGLKYRTLYDWIASHDRSKA